MNRAIPSGRELELRLSSNPGAPLPRSPIDAFLAADGTPIWDRIDFDVFCPRCGYNLRTLSTPRCTECGLDFDWRVLLDRSAWRSAFLFEHHWRTHPVRSFVKTVALSFRPRRFWRRVSLQEQVVRGPLYFLLLIAPVVLLVALHGGAWVLSVLTGWMSGPPGPVTSVAPQGLADPALIALIRNLYSTYTSVAQAPFAGGGDYLVWVYLSVILVLAAAFLLLSGLRQTLGRCQVRTAHILRVVAYSAFPVCAWIAAIVLLECAGLAIARQPGMEVSVIFVVFIQWIALVGALIILTAWISIGLKEYAKLPRPRILGFTAAFVALLTLMTAAIAIAVWTGQLDV
jgi:hypothetical protein